MRIAGATAINNAVVRTNLTCSDTIIVFTIVRITNLTAGRWIFWATTGTGGLITIVGHRPVAIVGMQDITKRAATTTLHFPGEGSADRTVTKLGSRWTPHGHITRDIPIGALALPKIYTTTAWIGIRRLGWLPRREHNIIVVVVIVIIIVVIVVIVVVIVVIVAVVIVKTRRGEEEEEEHEDNQEEEDEEEGSRGGEEEEGGRGGGTRGN